MAYNFSGLVIYLFLIFNKPYNNKFIKTVYNIIKHIDFIPFIKNKRDSK
jgi:hypothetical protein